MDLEFFFLHLIFLVIEFVFLELKNTHNVTNKEKKKDNFLLMDFFIWLQNKFVGYVIDNDAILQDLFFLFFSSINTKIHRRSRRRCNSILPSQDELQSTHHHTLLHPRFSFSLWFLLSLLFPKHDLSGCLLRHGTPG